MVEPKPKRRRFVAVADRPSAELVGRQMQVTALAFSAFGTVHAARAYLNKVDELLGGRPLDVAGASADGLRQVCEALTILSRPAPAIA